ncbi:TPA: lactonase family protein [Enterobacter hormaechei subsp. steigerwaltii]|nr:lactonase family protein [Enterobacter hormaechei subsp. steigerwaltii]
MNHKLVVLFSGMISPVASEFSRSETENSGHHVYVNTNETAKKVIHYAQTKAGSLVEVGRTSTMGQGMGGYKRLTGQASAPDDIISAGAIPLRQDNKFLFVVNTDDNSVSGFPLGTDGELKFIDKIQTGEGDANTLTYND